MVTKGYQKGVYERVTKGIRGWGTADDLSVSQVFEPGDCAFHLTSQGVVFNRMLCPLPDSSQVRSSLAKRRPEAA